MCQLTKLTIAPYEKIGVPKVDCLANMALFCSVCPSLLLLLGKLCRIVLDDGYVAEVLLLMIEVTLLVVVLTPTLDISRGVSIGTA